MFEAQRNTDEFFPNKQQELLALLEGKTERLMIEYDDGNPENEGRLLRIEAMPEKLKEVFEKEYPVIKYFKEVPPSETLNPFK